LRKRLAKSPRWRPEERLDLVQRETEELQRQDLLQANEVRVAVEPVAGLRTLRRREEFLLVVEAQSADRYRRAARELAAPIDLVMQGFLLS
jgi:hypothetical protein